MYQPATKLLTLVLSLAVLVACEGEDQTLGQEDTGLPGEDGLRDGANGPTDQPTQGEGAANSSDAGIYESEIRNLVVTLVQRDVFVGGETGDTYRGSFTLQNGSNQRSMREINRVVIETPAGRASFTDWEGCGGTYGLELPSELTEVFRFELLYNSNISSILFRTSCGDSARMSAPPTIPTVMTVEVHGLYDDGAPFQLTTQAMTIDGR